MCTVSYLPLSSEGFVLTSTRDEKNIRKPALAPEQYKIHNKLVFFPKDPDAGGTWIAAEKGGYSLCLLNGGSKIHESSPPYRLSRGIVLLDFFRFKSYREYLDHYDFRDIEPFTLLIAGGRLDELRWDGQNIHHSELNPEKPKIWSSVTLYPEEVIRMREKWFHEWLLKDPVFSVANAVSFHKEAGTGDSQNDIMMNRDEVRTVSITSILRNKTGNEMIYEDIIRGKGFRKNIS